MTTTTITINILQTGDEKAFTEIYHQYYAKLLGYFIKKTRSEETAAELVQVVFIKLWKFKHTLSEAFSFDTQLFNIARTCLIDHTRQQALQKTRLTGLQQHQVAQPGHSYHSTFESNDYFDSLVKSLPPVRKKVFTLSRLQGMSHKEIAAQLSITVNTVEDHMTKAMRRIRTILTSVF